LRIIFDLPEALPALPAAVEVAAYRILQEALNNVVRHAEARSCCVHLKLDAETLYLEVIDDGRGLMAGRTAGIGLASMHERAAELGGVCTVEPGQPEGTRVWALLPFRSHEDADGQLTVIPSWPGVMQQEA
jgi:signal transduction histidine kinase